MISIWHPPIAALFFDGQDPPRRVTDVTSLEPLCERARLGLEAVAQARRPTWVAAPGKRAGCPGGGRGGVNRTGRIDDIVEINFVLSAALLPGPEADGFSVREGHGRANETSAACESPPPRPTSPIKIRTRL